jgi:hypothetical protein
VSGPFFATRQYTPRKSSSSKDSPNPSEEPVNPADESSTTPEQHTTAQSDITKDPLSQDMPATPGSLLSQYGVQEEPTAVETTKSTTGQKKEGYVSSVDKKRDRMAKIFTWGFLAGLFGMGVYLGRPLEEAERSRGGWGDVLPLYALLM